MIPDQAAAAGTSIADAAHLAFAADVQYYLRQRPRQLPSRYLYDDLGSALFEAICRLPWYRITRSEDRLLAAHRDEIFASLGLPRRGAGATPALRTIVELGSGSGEKLRTLLDTPMLDADGLAIHLVDLSAHALELSARTLEHFPQVEVTMHRLAYEPGLVEAARRFDEAGRVLVLFLGSNIGNFDPPASLEFLLAIRGQLRAGDALLLGADLVKPEADLLLAYDDPLGVTAAFNRNLLVRINRELGGDFAIEHFAHRAGWNAAASRIEMHLVARTAQRVRVAAAEVDVVLKAGECIWTESSYKYRQEDIHALLAESGFRAASQWIDAADAMALTLAEAVEP
jgi:dimethylhistidine N-methyltransferase